jgi:hypothetical protein
VLSDAYDAHVKALASTVPQNEDGEPPISMTEYDFHAAVRIGGHDVVKEDFSRRVTSVVNALKRFGWTTIDRQSGQIVEKQQGVLRTNVRSEHHENPSFTVLTRLLSPSVLTGRNRSMLLSCPHR